MEMFARRIWNMNDVNMIVTGIKEGIKAEVFSDISLMEILRLISSKNVTFYVFGVELKSLSDKVLSKDGKVAYVGFGAVRNDREVYKIFVNKQCRRMGFGIRISLWIKQLILKHGYVPICWIKQKNERWNKTMNTQGMIKMADSYGETNKYMLRDFDTYVKAVKKYNIDNIKYVKTDKITGLKYVRRIVGYR